MNVLGEGRDRRGDLLLIREAEPRDGAAWLLHMRRTIAETPFLLQSSDDKLPSTGEQERTLARYRERPGCLALIAERPARRGRAVFMGCLNYGAGDTMRTMHAAELSMSVGRTHWGRGIGDALMHAAIAHARDDAGLLRLALQVFVSNIAAHRLYRKHGFIEEGLMRRYVRLGDGWEDIIPMGLWLGGREGGTDAPRT